MSEPKEVKPEEKKEEKLEVKPPADDDESGEDDDYDPQEEIWRDVENQINLPEIKVETGEEDDQLIASFRIKLYRWRKEWKERGVGTAKILKRKAAKPEDVKIRLLVRADKTHKVIANHVLWREGPLGKIEPLKTANNAWMWTAFDFSDLEPHVEKFAARLPKEDSDRFFREYEKSIDFNHNVPPMPSAADRETYLLNEQVKRQKEREEKKKAEAEPEKKQ